MPKAPPPKKPTPVKPTVVVELTDNDRPHLNGNGNGTGPTGARNQQATAIKRSEVLGAVSGLTLDGVSGTIASTQAEVQKSLAGLSAKLVEQVSVLRDVEEAIGLKRDELKQLYDIESAAIELDDLQAKIDAQQEAWVEEQARKKREFEEQRSDRTRQWVREDEEYHYDLAQKHKKIEDDFRYKVAEQERTNREKQQQIDKDWAERENELKKREKEVEDLKANVANFPEVVKKEVNAAVAVATNSVKKEYETKATLAAKDAETAAKLATQEAASLKQALDKANAQYLEIKAQLEQAHRDIKEISAKAVDSASGRSALEALQKVLEKETPTKLSK